jgi:hypothetical protein
VISKERVFPERRTNFCTSCKQQSIPHIQSKTSPTHSAIICRNKRSRFMGNLCIGIQVKPTDFPTKLTLKVCISTQMIIYIYIYIYTHFQSASELYRLSYRRWYANFSANFIGLRDVAWSGRRTPTVVNLFPRPEQLLFLSAPSFILTRFSGHRSRPIATKKTR